MDDNAIIDLYNARNESAIAETSLKYGRKLRGVSYNIVMDELTAEECENDTYLRAWSSIPPSQPRTYLFSYLACIIRRLSIDRCRNEQRLKRSGTIVSLTTELEECIASGQSMEDGAEMLISELNSFLARQTREKRAVFVRRYYYLDSIEAIAARYKMSRSKVTSMLFRMREAFRASLTDV